MNLDDEIKLLIQEATYANSNKKPFKLNKLFFKTFCITLLCCINLFTGIFIASYFNFFPKNNYQKVQISDSFFSQSDKSEFRKLVKKLAKKENKHPNAIHAELRNKFNYKSYHYLNTQTYLKAKNYLQLRLK